MSVSQFPPTSSHLQLFDISHDCYWKIHHNIMSCHIIWVFFIPGSYLLLLLETFYCLWKSLLHAEVHPEVKLVKNIVGIWKGWANDSALVFEPGAGWCSGCTFGLLVSMLPPKISVKKFGFTSAIADFGCRLSLVGKNRYT